MRGGGSGLDLCLGKDLIHHVLHLVYLAFQVISEDTCQRDGAEHVEQSSEPHGQKHSRGHVHLVIETGSEYKAEQGSCDGVEHSRDGTEYKGEQCHAGEDHETVFPAVFCCINDHWNRQNVDEHLLEEGAGLPVQEQKHRKDGDDHGSGGYF